MGRLSLLLKKVNELTIDGFRKRAIDLLSEYTKDKSKNKNSVVYKTLGRLYALEGDKEKSIEYLEKASEESLSLNEFKSKNQHYNPHIINSDDFDFIEASVLDSSNNLQTYELDEENVQSSNNDDKTLALKTEFPTRKNKENISSESIKISYKKRKFMESSTLNEKEKQFKKNIINKNIKNDKPTVFPEKITQEDDIDGFNATCTDTNKDSPKPILDDTSDEEDIYVWGEFDDLDTNTDFPKPILDDSDEDTFGWDEFDDLEEVAEEELRASQEKVDTEGTLTLNKRAKQVAASFISETNWDNQHLEFLIEIFETRGWGAVKRVLLKAYEKGLTPEELYLAYDLREVWKNSQQFWTTFSRIKSNSWGQQAESIYKNLSWAEAFRIIRIFPNYPSTEELILFLESEYENWYNSASSRRAFKTFLRYLKYRIGSLHSALPRDLIYSFGNPVGYDYLFDNLRYGYTGSEELQTINDYDIEIFEDLLSRDTVFYYINLYHNDKLLKESTLSVIKSPHN